MAKVLAIGQVLERQLLSSYAGLRLLQPFNQDAAPVNCWV